MQTSPGESVKFNPAIVGTFDVGGRLSCGISFSNTIFATDRRKIHNLGFLGGNDLYKSFNL